MKINRKKDEKDFSTLNIGDTFEFENHYYMKISDYSGAKTNTVFNTISLETTVLELWHNYNLIQPVNLVGVIDYEHNS